MRSLKQFVIRLTLAVILTVSGFAATGAPFAAQTFQGISSPQQMAGLAAWYDVSDVSSLRNNAGSVPSNGEGIKLVSDKSGNSSVNCLVLNGAAGNYASASDSVPLSITGDIDLRGYVAANDWTPSVSADIVTKWTATGNQRSYGLELSGGGTSGRLNLSWSVDGSAATTVQSTVIVGASDFSALWIRATLDVDNGAAGYTATFYTSADGNSWTQLGDQVIGVGPTSIFDGTAGVNVGAFNAGTSGPWGGIIYRAQIYNGIAGTLVFDANFATAAKLAPSFTESSSNAATVTINTSGATGARISGARDLYQGTAANQPILTIAATGNYLTFDGSNDYLKAGSFALSQPESVYFVGAQVTWTNGEPLYDGNAVASTRLFQRTTTPQLTNDSSGNSPSNVLALNTPGVLTAVFNGASSSYRGNRGAAVTTSSSPVGNGFTLGSAADGTLPSNITFSEAAIYSVAATTAQQDSFIGYAARKWGISGGFAHNSVIQFPHSPDIAPWKREDELQAA